MCQLKTRMIIGIVAGLSLGCHAPPAPNPPAAATTVRAPAASVVVAPTATAPNAVPHELHIGEDSRCKSEAIPVSIELGTTPDGRVASLADVLGMFGEMSGMKMTCEDCPAGLVVKGKVENIPWDCIVNHLAAQANLSVTVGQDTIVLAPKP